MKRITRILILMMVSILGGMDGFASEVTPKKGIFDVLAYQQVVHIDLTFDHEAVLTNRRSGEEHMAQMQFEDESGAVQDWTVELSLRGKFRRLKCSEVPPLKIKFKKKHLAKAGLADFNDFKLVTYCVDDYHEAKEFLLREYLVYKMYNEITEYSFRVQLVKMSYIDSKTGQKLKQYGFLIEDTAQLRNRVAAKKSKEERIIEPERYHLEYRKTAALFQYLIGNADWGLTYGKNIKYIIQDEKVIPVPYDFDFSALVNASYALVISQYGQTALSDRVYLGFEESDIELDATIQLFQAKKDVLYRTIQEFKLLKGSSRREMIAYLDTFYSEDRSPIAFPLVGTTNTTAAKSVN